MKSKENETGGETLVVTAGDRLDDLPASHAGLITTAIRDVFRDPAAWLRDTADRCDFPEMRAWLLEAAGLDAWQLELDVFGYDPEVSFAGFYWRGMKWYARLSPPSEVLPDHLSETMAAFYSLVGEVDTNGSGVAGGFSSADEHWLLSSFLGVGEEVGCDPEQVVVWGDSPCGDMAVFTAEGDAGWFDHEARRIGLLGSEADMIDWIFGRLRRGEAPYPR